MASQSIADSIIKATSAELRTVVWRRVVRGVAHDLLNLVMPLRSLGGPTASEADAELRSQLAGKTAARMKAIGLTLHCLEASIRDEPDEQAGRWPLLREVIRWALPREVRLAYDDESEGDLGSVLTPPSASLVFWTAVFCGELLGSEGGEIGVDSTPEAILLRLPGKLQPDSGATAAEAWTALRALADHGLVEMAPHPETDGPITVAVHVVYADGSAGLPRRARA